MSNEPQRALRRDQSEVPLRVNEPKMVGPLSTDEVAPIVVLTAIGVMFGQTNIGLCAGIALGLAKIKLQAYFPAGYLFHFLWYRGLWPTKLDKYLPDPMQREFYQ